MEAEPDDASCADDRAAVAPHPGLRGKARDRPGRRGARARTDWLAGPGDDGAVVAAVRRARWSRGEALWPPFVRADPYGAGVAAVLANVNDLAAMGAVPLAIVDTIVGDRGGRPGRARGHAPRRRALRRADRRRAPHPPRRRARDLGVRRSAAADGRPVGDAGRRPASAWSSRAALDGRDARRLPVLPVLRAARRAAGRRRARCSPTLAAQRRRAWRPRTSAWPGSSARWRCCWSAGRFGVTVDLDALPAPTGVDLAAWLTCFPCFAFLLCVAARARGGRCVGPFHGARARGRRASGTSTTPGGSPCAGATPSRPPTTSPGARSHGSPGPAGEWFRARRRAGRVP